jgi:hypothetical protein
VTLPSVDHTGTHAFDGPATDLATPITHRIRRCHRLGWVAARPSTRNSYSRQVCRGDLAVLVMATTSLI